MKASGNATMLQHMFTAHCKYCAAPPVIVKNLPGAKTEKRCLEHIHGVTK
jgi:hypothetical protein